MALSQYRYKSAEWSKADKLLDNWWCFVIRFIPRWLAPNAITLIGTIALIGSLVLAHTVNEPCPGIVHRKSVGDALGNIPQLKNINVSIAMGPDYLPPWANWVIVFAMFVYQTLDAVDGKQARRTRSSSPLGQVRDSSIQIDTNTPLSVLIAPSYYSFISTLPD
jgi:ethanolaminephosphotransferase